ncbi:TPA: restriction endonuclease subunit S [Streptococcus suis]
MSFSEWKEYKLEDVTINYNSKRVPLSSKERELRQGKYPYYGAQGVIDFIDKFIFEGQYLLVAEDGANLETRNEDIARLTKNQEQFWVNNHAHILRSNENSDIRYIKYFLNKSDLSGYITGSAQPKLNKANLNSIRVVLPPFEEQKAIAHILSTLDEKIEVNNQINKTLENMAQAIFKQWFVDFEFPNEDGEPYKSSGGEMVESELGMIPKGWEVKPFEDAFYFQEGPGIRNWQYVENGTKFINIRCIRDNDLYLETANMISFEEAEGKYKHFMIDSGDIVMSTSGTLGRNAIVREEHLPLCLNTSVIRFKPLHGQEHYSYMYAYLTSNEFLNHLTTKASGSVQKNFGPMHLRQIKLLYPNVSIIKLLNAIISPIIKSSLHTKKENDKLKKLRDTLLPKLISGEIRVPLDEEGEAS